MNKNKINKKVLERLQFSEEEIKELLSARVISISEDDKFYTYTSNSNIYDFSKLQQYKHNYELSNKCLRLCLHIDPYFFKASNTLFYLALNQGKIDEAVSLLRNLIRAKHQPYLSTYLTYLYIFSCIIPLPEDLKIKANSLILEDLYIKAVSSRPFEMDKQQEIRKLIYHQKFSFALKIVRNLRESNDSLHKSLFPLAVLLQYGITKRIEMKETLKKLVSENDIKGAIQVLEREKSLHKINVADKYTLLALKDLEVLCLLGTLPQRRSNIGLHPNIYDAIHRGDYNLAKNMKNKYENNNDFLLDLIIDKILEEQKNQSHQKVISL